MQAVPLAQGAASTGGPSGLLGWRWAGAIFNLCFAGLSALVQLRQLWLEEACFCWLNLFALEASTCGAVDLK